MDAISREDRTEVTFSTFYEMMRGCTERDILLRGIKNRVPHEFIEKMFYDSNIYVCENHFAGGDEDE